MHKMNRIMIVIILLMVLLIVLLDFIGFHGTILLDKVGNGALTNVIDNFWGLFEGENAFTNFMYISVIGIGLTAAVSGIIYKFIQS